MTTEATCLLPIHRRFLFLHQGLVLAAVNLPINAAIAWLMYRRMETVPLWGGQGIAFDTFATAFLLPLLVCLFATPPARRQMQAGTLPPLQPQGIAERLVRRLPRRTRLRGLALGLISMAIVAPAAVGVLMLLNIDAMDFGNFVVFKSLFAAALAGLVGPLIGLCALASSR